MERIMKAQAMGDSRASEYMKGKKTMEINPTSAVILDLKKKQEAGDASAATTAELLFDTAMLTSGFTIEQPADFAAKIFALMGEAVGDKSTADASGGFVPESKKKKEETKKKDDEDDAAESVDAEIV
jgi:heat shock protein beta